MLWSQSPVAYVLHSNQRSWKRLFKVLGFWCRFFADLSRVAVSRLKRTGHLFAHEGCGPYSLVSRQIDLQGFGIDEMTAGVGSLWPILTSSPGHSSWVRTPRTLPSTRVKTENELCPAQWNSP